MSPLSLTETDRQAAWRLLLRAYADARELGERGYALCRRRFFDHGDRSPELLVVLSREILRRRQFDAEGRVVLLHVGDGDGPDAAEARRGVVRADARLREFHPERLEWYREALANGSLSAGLVLTKGFLERAFEDRELALAALQRCLAETDERPWQVFGIPRETAVRHYADLLLEAPPEPGAIAAVEQAAALDPDNVAYHRYLAAARRPDLSAPSLRVYEHLFTLAPDDSENTSFLAEHLVRGEIDSALACEVLAHYLRSGAGEEQAVLLALARAAARCGRDDDQALGWLREVVGEPGAPAELTAWLAVCESRRGALTGLAAERARAALFDEAVPAAWRAEVGLALAESAGDAADDALLELVWQVLPPDERPDWLARRLAQRFLAAERHDCLATEVHRTVYELEPSPENARALGRAYLSDGTVDVRERIAHWRRCLEQRVADEEMMAALAKAYADEGSATEAALHVVENMPEAQRPRVLAELSGYRFRRGDFGSAETICGALLQARPDDPEALFKLLACRVRRALANGDPLENLDLSAAERYPEHDGLAALRVLVDLLCGREVSDEALTAAAARLSYRSLGLEAALAVLRGDTVDVEPPGCEDGPETCLLAAVELVQGDSHKARQRLGGASDSLARLWGRVIAAREALLAGRGEQAWQLVTPLIHHRGPPFDILQPVLTDLALRHASAAVLGSAALRLDPRRRFGIELRRVADEAVESGAGALAKLGEVDAETAPEVWREVRVAVAAQVVPRLLADGQSEAAERLLQALRDDDETADPVIWLSALLAAGRGDLEAALAYAYRLPEQVRARPAVAWTVARWFLDNHQGRMAEATLALAWRARPDDVDLCMAVAALNAQLGRGAPFVAAATQLLETLPADDPRRDGLDLLCEAFSTDLAQFDSARLVVGLADLPPAAVAVRLKLLLAVAVARIARGDAAGAATMLTERLEELRGARLPRAVAAEVAELQNALAYAHYLAGDHDRATACLRGIRPRPPSVYHNLAVVAEAREDHATAAQRWEQYLEHADESAAAAVSSTYPAALGFATHSHVAGLYRALERWAEEWRHVEACIKLRPLDVATQRASIQPLLALGEVDQALHKSNWLLTQCPGDVQVKLDHASVLASARGAREAAAYLDQVVREHPEAVEAVRQRREELRERLMELMRERAAASDWRAMFAAARDVADLAEDDPSRGEALWQQAVALSNMAAEGEATALLDQALARCDEALALAIPPALAERFREFRVKLGHLLAPHLAAQADGLFRHRRKAFFTIEEANPPPPDAPVQLEQLAQAFDRVAGLFERAYALGQAGFREGIRERIGESKQLAANCRALAQRLAARR